jgi:hypothetical protein
MDDDIVRARAVFKKDMTRSQHHAMSDGMADIA